MAAAAAAAAARCARAEAAAPLRRASRADVSENVAARTPADAAQPPEGPSAHRSWAWDDILWEPGLIAAIPARDATAAAHMLPPLLRAQHAAAPSASPLAASCAARAPHYYGGMVAGGGDAASPDGSPRGEAHVGVDAAAAFGAPWCAALKLPCARPQQLPAAGLRPAALAALEALGHRGAVPLQACVRPGCTLLTFDAVLAADDDAGVDANVHAADGDARAAAALRAMLSEGGAAGAFLRSQATVHLALGGTRGGTASAAFGQLLPRPPGEAQAQPRRLPPLTPMALLSSSAGALRLAPGDGADEAAAEAAAAALLPPPGAPPRLACRLHGQYVALQAAPMRGHVAGVPATDAEGVALFDLAPPADAAAAGARTAAPRPVLLTRDASIAAEVNAEEATLPHAPADAAAAARASLEAAVIALGHAMRPGCPLQLLARACAAALHRGWASAAARLVPELAARLAEREAAAQEGSAVSGDDVAAPRGCTLLHAAAAGGRAELAALVVRCGGARGRLGRAEAAGPGGATPLHVACRPEARPGADGAALAARLTDAAGGDAAARALVAWFSAHDAAGRTPSQMACAPGAAPGLAPLDAALRPRLRGGAHLARALAAALLEDDPHAAEVQPAALARRAADLARGREPTPPGGAVATALEHTSADARAVAAALLGATVDGIEKRTGGASAAISAAMQL